MKVKKVKREGADRHPNAGPCQRCWNENAPRYGNGFGDGRGASPHCYDCQPIVKAELDAERARQREGRAR